MNYTTFFHQTDSERMVEPNARFYKPLNFEERLAEVQRRIEELNLRARQSNSAVTGLIPGSQDHMPSAEASGAMMAQGYGAQVMM